ncbi:hypothetical protein, partial [Nocardioides sp.]|uniref:hypothetical protein n=1 Tax=Nocardioides sp. TaxID=35761 RepID=UPI0035122C25
MHPHRPRADRPLATAPERAPRRWRRGAGILGLVLAALVTAGFGAGVAGSAPGGGDVRDRAFPVATADPVGAAGRGG